MGMAESPFTCIRCEKPIRWNTKACAVLVQSATHELGLVHDKPACLSSEDQIKCRAFVTPIAPSAEPSDE